MSNSAFDQKIQDVFGEFAIDKGLVRRLGATGEDRHVPSYVMDWIVTHNAKSHQSTGSIERAVRDFIAKHLPPKGDKERIRFCCRRARRSSCWMRSPSVSNSAKRSDTSGRSTAWMNPKALIDASIIEQNQGLLQGSTWGAVKICYDGSPEGGGIRILDFKPMQTGRISLDVFRECRGAFTVEEWLDLIVRTLGYEPSMYAETEKLWMLCRLIPLVQNRINLMELAPPGSGKSYLYNNVSRHVWLTAGEITPPVLFYNRQTKAPGLLTRFDVLGLGRGAIASLLQRGRDAGAVERLLGAGGVPAWRVPGHRGMRVGVVGQHRPAAARSAAIQEWQADVWPARPDYIRRLPELFHESPTVRPVSRHHSRAGKSRRSRRSNRRTDSV